MKNPVRDNAATDPAEPPSSGKKARRRAQGGDRETRRLRKAEMRRSRQASAGHEHGADRKKTGPTGDEASSVIAPRQLVVFVHIPKTAGSTVTRLLRSNEPAHLHIANVFKGGGGVVTDPPYERVIRRVRHERDARLLHGHMPFGLDGFIPGGWDMRYVTFLREPVDRALSHYYLQLGRRPGKPDGPGPKRLARIQRAGGSVDNRRLTAETDPDRAFSHLCFVPDNLQTRMLCGWPEPFGEVTEEMLAQAKANLETRFAVVGLVERFDESLALIRHRLGYRRVFPRRRRRVNTDRPRGSAVPAELRTAAERANVFDGELYRFARALFDRAPEAGDPDFQIDVAALRRLAGKPATDGPPPSCFTGDPASWLAQIERRAAVLLQESRQPV